MKLIRFIAFLFYRYYSGGKRPDSAPMFSTLSSMTMLVCLQLMLILAIFNRIDIIPIKSSDNIWHQKMVAALLILPIFILLNLIIKKKDLVEIKAQYDNHKDKVQKGNIYLIAYIILMFILLVAFGFLNKKVS
jgi:hypothetical protein